MSFWMVDIRVDYACVTVNVSSIHGSGSEAMIQQKRTITDITWPKYHTNQQMFYISQSMDT